MLVATSITLVSAAHSCKRLKPKHITRRTEPSRQPHSRGLLTALGANSTFCCWIRSERLQGPVMQLGLHDPFLNVLLEAVGIPLTCKLGFDNLHWISTGEVPDVILPSMLAEAQWIKVRLSEENGKCYNVCQRAIHALNQGAAIKTCNRLRTCFSQLAASWM